MKKNIPLIASLALLLCACGTSPTSSSAPGLSTPPAPEPSTPASASVTPEHSSEPSSSAAEQSVAPPSSSSSPAQTSSQPQQTSSSSSPSSSAQSSSKPSSSSAQSSSSSQAQSSSSSAQKTRKYDRLQTKTIENMPSDFIYGMDASAVPSLEASGVIYRNEYGEKEDVFKILADNGVNYIRVRVWNDPYHSTTRKGYGGGNCDVNNAIKIGKRATANGMKLLVDFHYSDFWADPAKQNAPKAWKNYTLAQKKTALYNFTKDSLDAMKAENIDVGMVQVGNETNNFRMCGETVQANTIALMAEGSKAVREVYPNALVAVHFTNPEKNRHPSNAAALNSAGLDYDVFGTSYYPYWHGTLSNLASTLSTVASTYNKKVMVMETSYLWTDQTFDIFGNTEPKDGDTFPHDISMQGQYDQVMDVIETIGKNTTNGIGVCYWEGTWMGVNNGTGTWSQNQALWDQYGSGWATIQAQEYDSQVTQTEGSAVDNETFFDSKGVLLPSIEAFHHGGEVPTPTPVSTELLTNGSFENGTDPWQVQSLTEGKSTFGTFASKTDQYATMVDGTHALNIWDSEPIHAKIYQQVSNVPAGTHTFKISVMGECEGATLKAYVLTGAGTTSNVSLSLNGYNQWDSKSVEFTLSSAGTVVVGVEVNFPIAGGWAYFDGASLK